MEKIMNFYYSKKKMLQFIIVGLLVLLFLLPILTTKHVKQDYEYVNKEDVALYIKTYHELPSNYITNYGIETSGGRGDLTNKIVGGDTHWNTGSLSDFRINQNSHLKECDIKGENYDIENNRGILRLVYTTNVKNVRVFYTDSHYAPGSYEEITTFQLQLTSVIFWIIFAVYLGGCVTLTLFVYYYQKKKPIKQTN